MANHDHHHHHPHSPAPSLNDIVMQQVGQCVEQFFQESTVKNEIIGRVMQHVGAGLSALAAGYVQLQPRDVLTPPKQFNDAGTAVLLTTTLSKAGNTYNLLAECKFAEDNQRDFACTVFRSDELHSLNSQFVALEPAMQAELLRQLAVICTKPGSVLLGLVIVEGYFKTAPANPEDPVAPSPAPADSRAETLQQAGLGLPEVEPLL